MFVGASVGGVLGAFLASPVIASLQVLMIYMLKKVAQEDPFPGQSAPFVVGDDRSASRNRTRALLKDLVSR